MTAIELVGAHLLALRAADVIPATAYAVIIQVVACGPVAGIHFIYNVDASTAREAFERMQTKAAGIYFFAERSTGWVLESPEGVLS